MFYNLYILQRVQLNQAVALRSAAPQKCQFTGQESWGVKARATTMEDTISVLIHSFNVFLGPHFTTLHYEITSDLLLSVLTIPQGACKHFKEKSMFWYTSLPRTIHFVHLGHLMWCPVVRETHNQVNCLQVGSIIWYCVFIWMEHACRLGVIRSLRIMFTSTLFLSQVSKRGWSILYYFLREACVLLRI